MVSFIDSNDLSSILLVFIQCGGIRLWKYTRMEDYIRDGLRLAYGMGVKSALAGLW